MKKMWVHLLLIVAIVLFVLYGNGGDVWSDQRTQYESIIQQYEHNFDSLNFVLRSNEQTIDSLAAIDIDTIYYDTIANVIRLPADSTVLLFTKWTDSVIARGYDGTCPR